MKDSKASSNSASSRLRGPYASQACDICRRKKIKCNGVKPVCGACLGSKRTQECSWTGENVRVPRSEAHFEALRKRVEALQGYVDLLEAMLKECHDEHGGSNASFLHLRPNLADPELEEEEDVTLELTSATANLKLEDRGLVMYSSVAPFRFDSSSSMSSRIPEIVNDPTMHYVLLQDGDDESLYNNGINWSLYLPRGGLDRRNHDKLLDLLFLFFTSWCLRVVPALFLRDMYRALIAPISPPTSPSELPVPQLKTPHYSPMLHNALIALATAFSDDPVVSSYENRSRYAKEAKRYIEQECHKPNICVVQALSLLGSFHSSYGDQNLGYLYVGMSVRVGQILGLNVDCSSWVRQGLISHADMLDRNWVHWSSFSLDVCWSSYIGRDCSVPIPSEGQNIPVPFVDSGYDQIPWHYEGANIPSQPNYLTKTFAATCELCIVIRRIMEVVNGLSAPGSKHVLSNEVISRFDLQLNNWKSNLSGEIDISHSNRNTATPQKLMLHLFYWLAFILLHRPFIKHKTRHVYSSDRQIDHIKLCKRASDNIMEILETWQRLYGLRYTPVTLFQAIFSAGTVYLILAKHSANSSRVSRSSTTNLISQVQACVQHLLEVGKSWKSASNIGNILQKLLEAHLREEMQDISSHDDDETTQVSPRVPPGAIYTQPLHASPISSRTTSLESYTTSGSDWSDPALFGDLNFMSEMGLSNFAARNDDDDFQKLLDDMGGFVPSMFHVNYDSELLHHQLGNIDASGIQTSGIDMSANLDWNHLMGARI